MSGDSAPELAPQSASLFGHWKSLRRDGLLPSTEVWVDKASPAHVTSMFIADLIDGEAMLRFIGEDLIKRWGADLTGCGLFAVRTEKYRADAISNLMHVVSQPCGYSFENELRTRMDRNVHTSGIVLPLAVKPGRPPRVTCFSVELEGLGRDEAAADTVRVVKAAWIDIGAGTPPEPPRRPQRD